MSLIPPLSAHIDLNQSQLHHSNDSGNDSTTSCSRQPDTKSSQKDLINPAQHFNSFEPRTISHDNTSATSSPLRPQNFNYIKPISMITTTSSHNLDLQGLQMIYDSTPLKQVNPQQNSALINQNRSIEKYTTDDLIKQSLNKVHCLSRADKRRLVLDTPFSTRSTISYGLIVYARDTKRWAIIQRKHSVEFLLFIRGLYRLTHLPLLLSCVTRNEADIIHRCIKGGPTIFREVFVTELGLDENGLEYAMIRMAESRNVVVNLLSKLDLSKNVLKWTWPKGRLSYSNQSVNNARETPFACARREFTEEVEIELPSPLYISDTYVSENIRTITGRNIESRYWIYIIPNEIPMTQPEFHPEVSNREWVNTDTCGKLIQHKNLFQQIVNIVSTMETTSTT